MRFDPHLLMTALQRMWYQFEKKILPLYNKKVRPQNVGKKKEFQYLSLKFLEQYERKTKEEDEYQEKVKAARKERPSLYVGKTCRFSRTI